MLKQLRLNKENPQNALRDYTALLKSIQSPPVRPRPTERKGKERKDRKNDSPLQAIPSDNLGNLPDSPLLKDKESDSAEQPTKISLQYCLTKFRNAEEVPEILNRFEEILKNCNISLDPSAKEDVTPKLKEGTAHGAFWCRNLWDVFSCKQEQSVYSVPVSETPYNDVLIVGAGPAGLSAAIELKMMGANVHVIEKRDYLSRNNILHLWPWTVFYLKTLNTKVFYPKFATGGIEHVGTKQLQRSFLKSCLCLGVHVYYGVDFDGTEEAEEGRWRLKGEYLPSFSAPLAPKLSEIRFNTLIGADGEHSKVVDYFSIPQKVTKGSLCLGITQNYDHLHTEQELTINEFGISKVFNQKFFAGMKEKYGTDLENLVYYRGETHYFVMTATPESLESRGIFYEKKDNVCDLISPNNINIDNLLAYTRDVATWCNLPDYCPVTKNNLGKPDVSLFNFTNRHMSDEAAVLVPSSSQRDSSLLVGLVGDALLQPFWPLGTGLNRAILSSLDTAWMLREIKLGKQKEEIEKEAELNSD
eukprot:TRINITY_DN698_c0_g1_i11.p1 TRINITY_DN698_c0_g1~~TRINITY_DN698_c0_g1_i11.p1  ORF type:complete len:529 (+),score=80.46 TRINITY_DN698_c0_g1_i11:248-1834(+)